MINKDGVVKNIYNLLSKKREGCEKAINEFELLIAETVTFSEGVP